nr:hypothetical protein [Tanacetum cinerariifolium]
MAYSGPSYAIARRAIDEIAEFSRETETMKYMKVFIMQEIAKDKRFIRTLYEEAQSARNSLAQVREMVVEMEAMNDQDKYYDSLGTHFAVFPFFRGHEGMLGHGDRLAGMLGHVYMISEDAKSLVIHIYSLSYCTIVYCFEIVFEPYLYFITRQTDESYLKEKEILTPRNDDAYAINECMFKKPGGVPVTYNNADESYTASTDTTDQHHLYPVEFLNTLNFPGIPSCHLLKKGTPRNVHTECESKPGPMQRH